MELTVSCTLVKGQIIEGIWEIHNLKINDPKIMSDLSKCSAHNIPHVSPFFQTWIISFNVVYNDLLKWQH